MLVTMEENVNNQLSVQRYKSEQRTQFEIMKR